jgi:hypothetical protein
LGVRPSAPVDRASESIVNPSYDGDVRPIPGAKTAPAISSGQIEITPDSFSPVAASTASPSSTVSDPPPSAVLANARDRATPKMPLTAVVGIACAVFVVLTGLALLLFR